ncbi:helix-turn-helix domain-containing protein [Crossiella sp. SN42]|uniref:helix-turn-helix domain-containing protein n=1 Tax=Crossiella sp. SN42 TaxID=2944808 RepID=UPI00207D2985|nr:helix-turn-helix transcriptional regulator [Crossiella sp. SN42]MCO1580166.1 helix-turn-helix domain-containing protein [Crossiella sp. SN42]
MVSDVPEGLADALRYGPFHRALRESISCRGLSLARLTAHLRRLGISTGQSTLSYWQRGLRHPEVPGSLPTVRALETVLRLPSDSLVVLLGPQHRPPGADREKLTSFADLVEVGKITADLLEELDAAPEVHRCNTAMRVRMVHEVVAFGQDRVQRSVRSKLVVRAVQPGPYRYLAVYHGDDGADMTKVTVRAEEGCRIGRVRWRDGGPGALAIELLFDRRLAEGETHVFEYSVLDGTGAESPGYHRMLRTHCGAYLLQLSFHRKALPARCVRRVLAREDAVPAESEELVCADARVSAFFADAGPGLAGIAVDWR